MRGPRLQPLRRAREPKLGPLVPIIDAILEADKAAPPTQRHMAKRIFERPRIEHGFADGSTVVKDYVRLARTESREVVVPLAHPPGHAGGSLSANASASLAACGFDLPRPDDCFIRAYPAQTTDVFRDGRVSAFAS